MSDAKIHANLQPLAVPTSDLDLLPGNPRRGDVDAVARSYARFGQRKPIVARRQGDRGIVLAGNHQLLAARQLGWDRIAVVWTDDDDATAKAYALADNRTAELGGYDDDALALLLRDVQDTADLELLAATGFDDDAVARLLRGLEVTPGSGDPDDAPPLPATAVSRPGDVWQLGPHRLVCGDATQPDDVARLVEGRRVDMVWTDPPYGVAIVGGNHALSPEQRKARGGKTIENDELDAAALQVMLADALGNARQASRPGAVWFVAAPAGPLFGAFGQVLIDLGVWRHTITWVKDSLVMGRADYHYRHEPIFYGWTPGAAHRPPGDRTQDTVWEIPRPRRSAEHPTMKPVALITRAIGNHTDPGDLILDPFGGSGSTLIAANDTRRTALLLELDPRYCDVICRRYQNHTGVKPARDGLPVDFTKD